MQNIQTVWGQWGCWTQYIHYLFFLLKIRLIDKYLLTALSVGWIISIFLVCMVWMGKFIPRLKCSIRLYRNYITMLPVLQCYVLNVNVQRQIEKQHTSQTMHRCKMVEEAFHPQHSQNSHLGYYFSLCHQGLLYWTDLVVTRLIVYNKAIFK